MSDENPIDKMCSVHIQAALSFVGVTIGFLTLILAFFLTSDGQSTFSPEIRIIIESMLTVTVLSVGLFTISILYYDAGLAAIDKKFKAKMISKGNCLFREALALLVIPAMLFSVAVRFLWLMVLSIGITICILILYVRGVK